MSRKVKANLNDIASEEFGRIAQNLQIPEGEVLRRELAIMRYYSQALKEDPAASLMLCKGDTVSKLTII